MNPATSKFVVRSCVLAATLSLLGCGSQNRSRTSPPSPVVSVTLNQTSVNLAINASTQFIATVKGTNNPVVTWSVDGVTGGNATTGMINGTGLYTAPGQAGSHTVMATSEANTASSAQASVSVVNGVAVSPAIADVAAGQTQQFTATVPRPPASSVMWSVDNVAGGNATVGTITTSGLYTAPATVGSHTITATANSWSGSAAVTVFTLSVSPEAALVDPSGTQQFSANVQGLSNTAVTWSVDGVSGGNSTNGVITSSGLYTAPAATGPHMVAATSSADPLASASVPVTVVNVNETAVLTYHNDDTRDGAYTHEVTLTPANVNSNQFGKLLSYPVDGQIYGQPLYLPQITINGAAHDVVYVATQNNTLYAFDADANSSNPTTFRQVNVGPPVTKNDYSGVDPVVGILSTPVIDPMTGTIYFVAEVSGGSTPFWLYALNAATGAEQPGSPVEISGAFSGDTLESACYQRMGLALSPATNWVYIAFGSCTHGWVLAYDKSSLAQEAVFDDTAGGAGGGLWASGGAPVIEDSTGDVYLMSGVDAGDQEWITGSTMVGYNDSFLRLNGSTLAVLDYFSPDNNYVLATNDADLGAGANILVPGSSAMPNEILGGGKDGNIFVVDRDNMGGFNDSSNNVLQTVQTGTQQYDNIFSTPVYWTGSLYIHCNADVLRAYSWTASGNAGQQLSATATSLATAVFNMHGATPSLSANGSSNGIIWDIDNSAYNANNPSASGTAVLHAYDASNVATELYNSTQAGSRDTSGQALKFTVPTIANGRVFVPTANELDIYGLLSRP